MESVDRAAFHEPEGRTLTIIKQVGAGDLSSREAERPLTLCSLSLQWSECAEAQGLQQDRWLLTRHEFEEVRRVLRPDAALRN